GGDARPGPAAGARQAGRAGGARLVPAAPRADQARQLGRTPHGRLAREGAVLGRGPGRLLRRHGRRGPVPLPRARRQHEAGHHYRREFLPGLLPRAGGVHQRAGPALRRPRVRVAGGRRRASHGGPAGWRGRRSGGAAPPARGSRHRGGPRRVGARGVAHPGAAAPRVVHGAAAPLGGVPGGEPAVPAGGGRVLVPVGARRPAQTGGHPLRGVQGGDAREFEVAGRRGVRTSAGQGAPAVQPLTRSASSRPSSSASAPSRSRPGRH
ncbi:unnamed protein product, partial [Prorocentrum cordatum]